MYIYNFHYKILDNFKFYILNNLEYNFYYIQLENFIERMNGINQKIEN